MSISNDEINLHIFSDEELCRMTLNGDDHAFSLLVQRYNNLILLKISPYYGYNMDADDLFQEGVLGLLGAAKSYNSQKGASFKTYASICIERKIINMQKSFMRKKSSDKDNMIYSYDNNDFQSAQVSNYEFRSPEELIIDCESLDIKKEKIKKLLSELEYNVLSLHLTGHNYDEIAKDLSVNVKCVDNAMQRIRKKLTVLKKV